MKAKIKEILAGGVRSCVSAGLLPGADLPDWTLEPPKSRLHGDYATNLAFLLAPAAKKSPRQVAELLVGHLPPAPEAIARVEIAGPGFINIFVADALRRETLGEILAHESLAALGGEVPDVAEPTPRYRRAMTPYRDVWQALPPWLRPFAHFILRAFTEAVLARLSIV